MNSTFINVFTAIPFLIMIYVQIVYVLVPTFKAEENDRVNVQNAQNEIYGFAVWVQVLDLASCIFFVGGILVKINTDVDNIGSIYGFTAIKIVASLWLMNYIIKSKGN